MVRYVLLEDHFEDVWRVTWAGEDEGPGDKLGSFGVNQVRDGGGPVQENSWENGEIWESWGDRSWLISWREDGEVKADDRVYDLGNW